MRAGSLVVGVFTSYYRILSLSLCAVAPLLHVRYFLLRFDCGISCFFIAVTPELSCVVRRAVRQAEGSFEK